MGKFKSLISSFFLRITSSFRSKLLLSFLALSFVPLILSGFLMVKILSDNTSNEEIQQSKDASSEVDYRMNVLLSGIKDSFASLENSSALKETVASKTNNQDVYNLLYETTAGYRSYAEFSVYSEDGTCVLSTDAVRNLPEYWGILKDAKASPNQIVIRSEGDSDQPVLRIVKAIVVDDKVTGFMSASLDNANMAYLLSGIVSAQEGINIMDSYMETAYCSGPADALTVNNSMRSEMIRNGTVPEKMDNYDIYFTKLSNMDFYVVLLKQPLLSDSTVNDMYRLLYSLGIISIVLCFIVAWRISHSFSEPLTQMNGAMKKVQEGNLEVRIPENKRDEFGTLSKNFNVMTEELDNFVDQKVDTQKRLSDVQIAMMTAQLNPHFLYNTLDTIKWMAKSAHVEPIAMLSSKLARILRTSIEKKPLIPLKEECQLCSDYIDIQNIRFNGKYQLDINVSSSLMEQQIPKLILQPIVENSIKHGFDDVEKGIIKIEAVSDDDSMIITVSDNGCGMPEEMLHRINTHDWNGIYGHIGLYNVDMILRLNYGAESGLAAENKEDGGASITLKIPYREEDADV